MSNVVKAIVAADTGDRKFLKQKTSKLFQDVFDVREETHTIYTPEIAKVYRIGVTIGEQVVVPEYMHLDHGINRVKGQVIEAIFGEFRQDFRMVEKLLYDYDFEGAATALRDMEMKMYTTE